ncbi:MAG: hypothetical protein RLZ25_1602 [Pseudomonadota bacterium]|jgi:alkylated DNA repair dioxygenase AlkB
MAVKDTRNHGALRCHGGQFEIIPGFLSGKTADELLLSLIESLDWASERVRMFGRSIETRRKVAFFGTEPLSYGYTGTRHHAKAIPTPLIPILAAVQNSCAAPFNSILATRYPDGNAALGWHRDDETELGPRADIEIASLSLGATRPFEIRDPLTHETHRYPLEHGSLFFMRKGFQERWQHRVPKVSGTTLLRINLSFRTLKPAEDL